MSSPTHQQQQQPQTPTPQKSQSQNEKQEENLELQKPTTPYPPIKRILTGHTSSAHSTFLSTDTLPSYFFRNGKSMFTDVFWEDGNRPDLSGFGIRKEGGAGEGGFVDKAREHRDELIGKEGVVMKVVDTPPGGKSFFHRTETLDFGIVMRGEVVLVLDNGEREVCKAGDVVVQRGTIHAWQNETDEWARVYFVMLKTPPVKVGEQELREEYRGFL